MVSIRLIGEWLKVTRQSAGVERSSAKPLLELSFTFQHCTQEY
jgi:hypothetical protein